MRYLAPSTPRTGKVQTYQAYVPLPHVFPPSAIRQSPTGRATLGSRTLSGVASLCHSLRWCKKSQRTRNFVLLSGARRSLPRRRCSSRSVFEQVSACISTQRIGIVQKKALRVGVLFVNCNQSVRLGCRLCIEHHGVFCRCRQGQ